MLTSLGFNFLVCKWGDNINLPDRVVLRIKEVEMYDSVTGG